MGLISPWILEALGAQAPCWWILDALVPTACQHGFLLLEMAAGEAFGRPCGFATAGTEASQRVPLAMGATFGIYALRMLTKWL